MTPEKREKHQKIAENWAIKNDLIPCQIILLNDGADIVAYTGKKYNLLALGETVIAKAEGQGE